MLMSRNIEVVPYNSKWPELFETEAKLIRQALGDNCITKGKDIWTHNVHIYQEDDPEISRYLNFRDWMRSHPDDTESYTKLKVALAEKFPHDIL